MTAGERFTIIISLLTLVIAVMSALLGYVIKITSRWTQTEDKLSMLVDDVKEMIIRKDRDHEQIRLDVREKEARGEQVHRDLSERLTYVERQELARRRRQDPPRG